MNNVFGGFLFVTPDDRKVLSVTGLPLSPSVEQTNRRHPSVRLPQSHFAFVVDGMLAELLPCPNIFTSSRFRSQLPGASRALFQGGNTPWGGGRRRFVKRLTSPNCTGKPGPPELARIGCLSKDAYSWKFEAGAGTRLNQISTQHFSAL